MPIDGRYWIQITRVPVERAFFTKVDGKLEKKVVDDPALRRMIRQMRDDNLTEEEIRENVKVYLGANT